MLDVTIELITQTASSSLFAFCFCNFLIAVILVGSKPDSQFRREVEISTRLPMPSGTSKSEEEDAKKEIDLSKAENAKRWFLVEEEKCEKEGKSNKSVGLKEAENVERLLVEEEKGEKDDDDDDELRMRFEEFIQKVNRGWKAELSRTAYLIEV